ncbi:MAG: DUF3352 domain-containing protein [Candidatus Peregrinibacteria bacterium]|nr:DUF3352 domain-containing protein [Candidatus Peregrinibacteria bacterium]MDZ4245237.1 DUF3352 domain-containing protein [Candidatus Gracilibacteria bacterium]
MAKSKNKKAKRSGASKGENKAPNKVKKHVEHKVHKKHDEKHVAEAKPKAKRSLLGNLKNKFAALLLILLGLMSVVFIGAFFVKKAFEPLDIANVLPFDETVAMASLDGLSLVKDRSAIDSLADGSSFGINDLTSVIEEALDANFETDIKPWLGFKHGYALLQMTDENGVDKYEHVLFIQSINKKATLDFLGKFQLESLKDGLTSEKYNNYSIYSFAVGQNVSFLLLDKYFVFARDAQALKKIVDVRIGEADALISHDEFLAVRNNLKKDIGFVYYIPVKLFDYYMGEELSSGSALIRPILSLFQSQGHSMILNDKALIVQTYMNFDTAQSEERLPKLTSHYDGDLLRVMPPHFEYFWGSRDLSRVIAEFGVVLNQLHPSSFNVLEGVLNAKKEQYFGYEVDLREDIYKVFENEFALGLYAGPDHIDYLFVADEQDPDRIAKLQAYYMAAMQENGYRILEEGAPLNEGNSKSDQISVFPFDGRTNMYATMHKDIFVMGTSRELIEETLTHIDEGGLPSSDFTISSYLKDFDEINIASPALMGELLGEKWSKYLNNFTRIKAAKSIFPSGMALVHVFEF